MKGEIDCNGPVRAMWSLHYTLHKKGHEVCSTVIKECINNLCVTFFLWF